MWGESVEGGWEQERAGRDEQEASLCLEALEFITLVGFVFTPLDECTSCF